MESIYTDGSSVREIADRLAARDGGVVEVKHDELVDARCIGIVDSWTAYSLSDVLRPHVLVAEVVTDIADEVGGALWYSLYARPAVTR